MEAELRLRLPIHQRGGALLQPQFDHLLRPAICRLRLCAVRPLRRCQRLRLSLGGARLEFIQKFHLPPTHLVRYQSTE